MKTFLVSLLFIAGSIASAQENPDKYIETMRQDLKTNKVALITGAMNLPDSVSAKFWPVYREYDHELSNLGDRRVALIKDYAASYSAMTNDKAASIMKKFFANQQDRMALLKKYYGQMEKALGAITAAKFVQVEAQIQDLVDLQIGSQLPMFKQAGGTNK